MEIYGNGSVENQKFLYGTAQKLTRSSFDRVGFDFAGWTTVEDSEKVIYSDRENVNNLTSKDGGKVELYAVWN